MGLSLEKEGGETVEPAHEEFGDSILSFRERVVGSLAATDGEIPLRNAQVMTRLIYGLVNVRTDGERILAATMNEKDGSWAIKSFRSRF
jgi:hypothetical protein